MVRREYAAAPAGSRASRGKSGIRGGASAAAASNLFAAMDIRRTQPGTSVKILPGSAAYFSVSCSDPLSANSNFM